MYVATLAVPFFFLSSRFGVAVLAFFALSVVSVHRNSLDLLDRCIYNETDHWSLRTPTVNGTAASFALERVSTSSMEEAVCENDQILSLDVIQTRLGFTVYELTVSFPAFTFATDMYGGVHVFSDVSFSAATFPGFLTSSTFSQASTSQRRL